MKIIMIQEMRHLKAKIIRWNIQIGRKIQKMQTLKHILMSNSQKNNVNFIIC